MNLYGLPEFGAYTLLVAIACVLIYQRPSYSLGYWLAGWVLIVIHAGIFMLMPAQLPYDLVGRGTLALAGQAFLLAAFYQSSRASRSRRILIPVAISGSLNVAFQVVATAAAHHPTVHWSSGWLYALLALGVGATVWLVNADRSAGARAVALSTVLVLIVYGLQSVLLARQGPMMASQWLMCWTYLAAAYLFLRQTPTKSIGVTFTALSFALWGLVFPTYTLLAIYAPAAAAHVEAGVWNLPKFLAAAGMILALLEHRIASATYLATHDELTKLPNRRLYDRRLTEVITQAQRRDTGFALVVIDLNGFKTVNDTLGHQAGDELLQTVAARLRNVVRHTDTLARTGGDEFTAILEPVADITDVDHVPDAITHSLHEPITIQNTPCLVTASVGVAIYPADGTTITGLTTIADRRMYHDKEGKRGMPNAAQF
ncbi:diguanylate cyclase (GGDEF)-like protein [Mycobacterium sp. MAA66]